jgi:DNA-binding NarL/FixJ family response regulator
MVARVRRLVDKRPYTERRDPSVRNGGLELLTRRELQVLRLLASGVGAPAISRELVITSKTVSTHIQRILAKLGVHNQAQAVAAAYRLGLSENGGGD